MYRIEICDSVRGSALRLERILREKTDRAIIQTVSEEHLSAELQNGMMRPDILFVSVKLQTVDGVSLAARLKKADPMIRVVFLAGKSEDVSGIFEAEPVGLLIRPFQKEKVYDAFERATESFHELGAEYLQLKTREHLLRVRFEDICYIESDRRYLFIHKREGVERARMKLSELEGMLPEYFVRCHQSYLANIHMLERMSDQDITLVDGTRLPISRSRRQQTRETVMNFADFCCLKEKNMV